MRSKFIVSIIVWFVFLYVVFISFTYNFNSNNFNSNNFNYTQRLLEPSSDHIFGTDRFGKDVFLLLIEGAKYSVIPAFFSAVAALVIGWPLGMIARTSPLGFGGALKILNYCLFIYPPLFLKPLWSNRVLASLCIATTPIPVGFLFLPLMMSLKLTGPIWGSLIAGLMLAPIVAIALQGGDSLDFEPDERSGSFSWYGRSDLLQLGRIATSVYFWAILLLPRLDFVGMGIPPGMPSWAAMLRDSAFYDLQSFSYIRVAFSLSGFLLTMLAAFLLGDYLVSFIRRRNGQQIVAAF